MVNRITVEEAGYYGERIVLKAQEFGVKWVQWHLNFSDTGEKLKIDGAFGVLTSRARTQGTTNKKTPHAADLVPSGHEAFFIPVGQ